MFYFCLFILSCLTVTPEADPYSLTLNLEGPEEPQIYKTNSTLDSSVKIVLMDNEEYNGHGSGNYFKIGKHKFIITAAHVVFNEKTKYALDGDKLKEIEVLYLDRERDIAIVRPLSDLESVRAKTLRVNREDDLIGKKVYYYGFPNDIGRSYYTGSVAKAEKDHLIIQSFALPGSSGSILFDSKGRALGVVSGIQIIEFPVPQLVETCVYVNRLNFINKKFIRELMMDGKK